MTHVQPRSSLPPARVAHPAGGDRVRVFAGSADAARHTCDHLLTAPECRAWSLASDAYAEVAGGLGDDERWELACAAREDHNVLKDLFQVYVDAIEAAIADAQRLDWRATNGEDVHVAMGTSGLLVIIERGTVVTAHLPGQGEPAAVVASRDGERRGALPRESGMRRRGRAERERRCEQRRRQRSRQERLYHDVFKLAWRHVRSLSHHGCNPWGVPRNDAALLKHKLPRGSALDYASWSRFRKQCEGEDR